jgi:hypothetical protein
MNPQIKRAIEILKQNTQKELNLLNCCKNLLFSPLFSGIGDEGISIMQEYLKSNSSLHKLKLGCKFYQNFK